MFIDNVQECNYDEFSNDHVVIFIDHFLTMIFAFYIVNISCLNAMFHMLLYKPINIQSHLKYYHEKKFHKSQLYQEGI
jgi:hypothetical protein